MTPEYVIIVDERDEAVGIGEKVETHRHGRLHRAFSIFVFNSKGELMLQKRADSKYHSNGLWSNTCCGHPRPGESTLTAARRRLREEMGFTCDIQEVFEMLYYVQLTDEISEYEYDHILVGMFDGHPQLDETEVEDWKWVNLEALRSDLCVNPQAYTYWLKLFLDTVGCQ